MAIQLRRGSYSNLNPNNLLPGELAVVTSGDPNVSTGKALYICFSTGSITRIALGDESEEIVESLVEAINKTITNQLPYQTNIERTAASGGGTSDALELHSAYAPDTPENYTCFVYIKSITSTNDDVSDIKALLYASSSDTNPTEIEIHEDQLIDTKGLFKIVFKNDNADNTSATITVDTYQPTASVNAMLDKLSNATRFFTGSSEGPEITVGTTYREATPHRDLYLCTTTKELYFIESRGQTTMTVKKISGDGKWTSLATVNVASLSDTPDGFIWDVSNYDDLKIIANGMTSVTGNRNFVLRITTTGGTSSEIGMFANLINQTSKDIKAKLIRNTGTATMEVTGSIMRTAYPYVDDASYNRDVSVPAGKITKVELFISGGGGLATGDITLLGRKRG